MHSFQPSRWRISFEVLCAFGIAASCAGAWMQTGASGLLAAASVAALYGLVHFFDLFRRRPAVAEEARPAEIEPASPAESIAAPKLGAVEPQPVAGNLVEEMRSAVEAQLGQGDEEAAPPAKARRAKAPRKSGGRRASASKGSMVAQNAPPETLDDAPQPEVANVAESEPFDEPFHAPVAPLFEPEPFVRQQQRTMFGRKAS